MNSNSLYEFLLDLEQIIMFSIENGLNVHTSVSGKFGELWVAYHLWDFKPKLARSRSQVKEVKNPNSCDIVLCSTKKKLEVKWSKYHGEGDDLLKKTGGISCWGWGFSKGTQFIDKKFDYCILLAAEDKGARPEHVFVLKIDEMTKETMVENRKSSLGSKDSYFIEYSANEDFYTSRKWHPFGPSTIEEHLFNRKLHEERWFQLIENGKID